MKKIINVVGARPNFMKIAPLVHELGRRDTFTQLLVHTGQHYDDNLSRVFFDDLEIPRPDVNLEVGSGNRLEQIDVIMQRFEPVLLDYKPDLVTVVGDVNSTTACARVAKKHGVAVAHVEAGLRSFDLSMPEEHNRRETDEIADLLFVTEESGMSHLASENAPGKSFLVGNVMIDTLVENLERATHSTVMQTLGLQPRAYVVSTFHRPSNVDDRHHLSALLDTLELISGKITLVLPLHPRTRDSLDKHDLSARLASLTQVVACEPLGYLDFLRLLSQAKAAITDSGGIQEETTYLRVPCLTMRENTERPETINVGSNVLVGSDINKLEIELDNVLAGRFSVGEIPLLWDGRAAPRIVDVLEHELRG